MEEVKKEISLAPTYKITKIGDFSFKIFNFERNWSYLVEKKDVLFKKSKKTYKIWTCTCLSYKKWAWKTHSCKHIQLLEDIRSIK